MKQTNETALSRFALLEAEGRYFDGHTARPIEVIVKFGRTTLTLMHSDGTPIDHWALGALTALQGPMDRLALTPDTQSEERLLIVDPTMISAIREVCPDLDRRPKAERHHELSMLLKWGAGGLAMVLFIVFVLFPAIANNLAPLVPTQTAKAIGKQSERVLSYALSGGKAANYCEAPEGQAALLAMQARLEAGMGYETGLEVVVLQSALPNAFALPGNRILLTSALIQDADTPEEIAGILAHEIAHHEHHDMMRKLIRQTGTATFLTLVLGDFTGGTAVAITSDMLLNASYSRDAELAADKRAYEIMAATNLPSSPMGAFFDRLHPEEGHGHSHEGEEPAESFDLSSYFASHPAPEGRAVAAREADVIGEGTFTPALDDNNWLALRQICADYD